MPELRKDPVVDRWTVIATERASRPVDYKPDRGQPRGSATCPFCPGNEDRTPGAILSWSADRQPLAAGHKDWELRVVPNKYPALMIEGSLDRTGEGLYDRMNGIGAHEVIIETRRHDPRLDQLAIGDATRVLHAIRERMLDLARDSRFRYVMAFKNHGVAAGATQPHPHSQLIALPFVPVAIAEELEGAARHFEHKERCIYCDIVRQELHDGRRVIHQNADAVVLAPFASRFPFETWVVPRAHAARFEHAQPASLTGIAEALARALGKLGAALEDPPYNFMLHTAPLGDGPTPHYHWHIEIVPTLTKVAGFELGSGCSINPTPPEDAAAFLREISA
jgi:UDPglucose--hexose-1-phosphate uridylyltransferase